MESVTSHSCFCLVQISMPCPSHLLSISATLPHIPSIRRFSMVAKALPIFNDLTISRLLLPPSESALLLSTPLAS